MGAYRLPRKGEHTNPAIRVLPSPQRGIFLFGDWEDAQARPLHRHQPRPPNEGYAVLADGVSARGSTIQEV